MKKLLFLFVLLSLLTTSCKNEPSLVFRAEKSKTARHLGEGVWIDVPSFYKKAKTYDGFQAPKYASSISLQVDYATINDVKSSFDEKLLARKRTKLLKLETVLFGEVDSAVYAVVNDKRKETIRYLLSIKKRQSNVWGKGFLSRKVERPL